MARKIVVGALSVWALGAGLHAQEPPLLEAPASPSADSPPTPPSAERSQGVEEPSRRPLLVIPGVTAPRPQPARSDVASAPKAGDSNSDLATSIPLRLERLPTDDLDDLSDPNFDGPPPLGAPSGSRTTTEAGQKPTTSETHEAPTDPAASRRSSAVGRLLGVGGEVEGRNQLSVESTGDPAVEAAVKRRVEKQIQDALGDRVKDVQVRVAGRSILIRARASRFWHRWGVRRGLDALATPSGYRMHAQLLD